MQLNDVFSSPNVIGEITKTIVLPDAVMFNLFESDGDRSGWIVIILKELLYFVKRLSAPHCKSLKALSPRAGSNSAVKINDDPSWTLWVESVRLTDAASLSLMQHRIIT